MIRVRTLLGTLVAICLLAGAGCGLSTNDSPEELARDNLPSDLGGAPETSAPVPGTEGVPVDVWFMETSSDPPMLAPVEATAPRNPSAQVVVEMLFTFSPDDLADRRMRSALPSEARTVDDPTIEDDVLVLNFPESFYRGIVEDEGRYAYGQIVLTVAENFGSDIEAVHFLVDGQDAPVSDGEGVQHNSGVVRASDYDALRTG